MNRENRALSLIYFWAKDEIRFAMMIRNKKRDDNGNPLLISPSCDPYKKSAEMMRIADKWLDEAMELFRHKEDSNVCNSCGQSLPPDLGAQT